MRWAMRGLRVPMDPEVTVVLPDPLATEVRRLLETGDEVAAVRLTRLKTGMNLVPAVRAVRALGSRSGQ